MSPTNILHVCNTHYASSLNFLALLYFISTDILNFSTMTQLTHKLYP